MTRELLYDHRPGMGMDPDRPGVWIGDYWFACRYLPHRHYFHGKHTAADVSHRDRECEDTVRGDQLALDIGPRPVRHGPTPGPSAADHHFHDGRRVTP